MRTIGTVVRGVRAPIIREGDNIAEVAAASVMEAWKEAGIEPRDRDVVAVTESVVARAQGNYATLDQIAKDVREKTGGGTVGVAFPILSRNRFSLLLRGMAMGCKKIVLLLSYPSDEVGNGLVDWDKLDEAGVDPYSDVLTLEQFRKKSGAAVHPFTGVDYIDFYSGIIMKAIGIPMSMFTVIFAISRTIGWIAHWNEMHSDPDQKIGRPRQLYTGQPLREFVPLDQR